MLVALMSTPDRWPSGSPHAQIKVIVVELAARARDRAGEAGHECRFAGEELVALVERLIDKITIPISVCSPRTRGDTTKATTQKELAYFNPLPSCEGRLADLSRSHYCFRFQSTPLMRGETTWEITRADIGDISIHSPHARGDGRPNRTTKRYYPFQSTPLMRGETRVRALRDLLLRHFNPLPSCEGRLFIRANALASDDFNPLPSCEGRREPAKLHCAIPHLCREAGNCPYSLKVQDFFWQPQQKAPHAPYILQPHTICPHMAMDNPSSCPDGYAPPSAFLLLP